MACDDGHRGDLEEGAREDAFVAPTPQVSYILSTILMDLSKQGGRRGGALHFGRGWGTVSVRGCLPRARETKYGGGNQLGGKKGR